MSQDRQPYYSYHWCLNLSVPFERMIGEVLPTLPRGYAKDFLLRIVRAMMAHVEKNPDEFRKMVVDCVDDVMPCRFMLPPAVSSYSPTTPIQYPEHRRRRAAREGLPAEDEAPAPVEVAPEPTPAEVPRPAAAPRPPPAQRTLALDDKLSSPVKARRSVG